MTGLDPTTLIALYAALVSTILALRELRKDRRQVRVTCKAAFAPSPRGEVWEFIAVDAVNNGHRPVEIVSAGLMLNDKSEFTQLKSNAGRIPLPKKLEDGERVSVLFDLVEFKKALQAPDGTKRKFTKAVVRDAAGKTYSSRTPKALSKLTL